MMLKLEQRTVGLEPTKIGHVDRVILLLLLLSTEEKGIYPLKVVEIYYYYSTTLPLKLVQKTIKYLLHISSRSGSKNFWCKGEVSN